MRMVPSTAADAWAGFRYRVLEVPWARSLKARLVHSMRPLAQRSELDRNIHYLYVEVFWAAIFSAVFAFNATYVCARVQPTKWWDGSRRCPRCLPSF